MFCDRFILATSVTKFPSGRIHRLARCLERLRSTRPQGRTEVEDHRWQRYGSSIIVPYPSGVSYIDIPYVATCWLSWTMIYRRTELQTRSQRIVTHVPHSTRQARSGSTSSFHRDYHARKKLFHFGPEKIEKIFQDAESMAQISTRRARGTGDNQECSHS